MAKSERLTRNLEVWINNRDDLFDELKDTAASMDDMVDFSKKVEEYFEENLPENIPEPFNDFLQVGLKCVDWMRLARTFSEFLGTDLEE